MIALLISPTASLTQRGKSHSILQTQKNHPFFSKNRGESEAIRNLLYYVKIPFIDVRFDNKESFQDNSLSDTNIDPSQLPVLQLADENNTLLIKSVSSILRYIAKKAKSSDLLITLNPEILRLYPSDDIEAAKIDILLDQEKGMRVSIIDTS